MKPTQIEVVKRDHLGVEVFRYPGRILELTNTFVRLEAFFTYEAVQVEEIVLRRGDRFIETFYFDRWYNIFEIHAKTDNRLKAYYCNIGYPAIMENGEVSYRDLAIDLLVRPGGKESVLDMDEFDVLPLDKTTRQQALDAVSAVRTEISSLLHQAK